MKTTILSKFGGTRDSKDPLTLPINWDASHFIKLAVIDVRNAKNNMYKKSLHHVNRFIPRCNVFADEMKWCKEHAVLERVAEENNFQGLPFTVACTAIVSTVSL